MNKLPVFKYHPDPLKTGMVKPSEKQCICCNQKRGFIYVGPVDSDKDGFTDDALDEALCPWCIADGSAHEKCGATFHHGFTDWNIADSIKNEIYTRTPDFYSWQQEDWIVHCADVCEYHGMATARYLRDGITKEQKAAIREELQLDETEWANLMSSITKENEDCVLHHTELHIFICRHCKLSLYRMSCC